jgi:serine phosphatase RsbU (regulator of sigma subunit)
MSTETELIEKLTTLSHISETLNRAVDVRSVLNDTLAHLVDLMGLETGWIFLKDAAAQQRRWGQGYVLAAHHNLPPALDLDQAEAWTGGCACQDQCSRGSLNEAYNEVECSRLASVRGDRRGLAMHASTPLRSGGSSLGILNVAGPDWASFSPEALSLLANVGNQMGVALERARLFDLLQERRIHEQAVLLDFSNQLLARPEIGDLMDYLAGEVRQILQADACALLLPSQEADVIGFAASSGWRDDPVAAGREVPLDERSGPGWVMRTQQPLLVEDLERGDPTIWAPDWVRAEAFRCHAVVPLLVNGGSVGALVINARQPRSLDEDEMRLVRLLANQAAIALEKARLHEEEVKSQALEKELAVGREIQLSLLPKAPPAVAGWEFAAYYQPAQQVGGDFYDFFELGGEPSRLGMVIGDVTGKGVPAALFMAMSRTLIRTAALVGRSPSRVLMQANDMILDDSRSELMLTAFYAMLQTGTGRLAYACGGHNRPLWIQAGDGRVRELKARGLLLAALPGIELEEREIEVAPGDCLVFYTDGVTEAMDPDRQFFGQERLREVVATQADASAGQVLNAVVEAVKAFTRGSPAADDLTLFVVKRLKGGTTTA